MGVRSLPLVQFVLDARRSWLSRRIHWQLEIQLLQSIGRGVLDRLIDYSQRILEISILQWKLETEIPLVEREIETIELKDQLRFSRQWV